MLRADSELNLLSESSATINSDALLREAEECVGEAKPDEPQLEAPNQANSVVTMPPLLFDSGAPDIHRQVLTKTTSRALASIVGMTTQLSGGSSGGQFSGYWETCQQIDQTLREATSGFGSKDLLIKVVEDAKANLQGALEMHQRQLCQLEQAKHACDIQLGKLLAKQCANKRPKNRLQLRPSARACGYESGSKQLRDGCDTAEGDDIRDELQQILLKVRLATSAQKQIQRLLSVFSVLKIYTLLEPSPRAP